MAKTDKKTLELISQVRAQKAEIARLEKPSYKTNCCFSFIEGHKGSAVSLHVETDVRRLIVMAAFLIERQVSYQEAAKQLGVESVPEFSWDGYTAADWLADIKTRINKVQIGAKREKLSKLEDRLKKIISPELQAELELEAIEKELS